MGLLPAFFSSSCAVMISQVNYVLFHGINRSWAEAAVSKSLLVAVVCSKNCYHPSKPSVCGLFLPSAFHCSSVTSANSDGDSFTRSQRDISLNICCLAMKLPGTWLVFSSSLVLMTLLPVSWTCPPLVKKEGLLELMLPWCSEGRCPYPAGARYLAAGSVGPTQLTQPRNTEVLWS